MSSHTREFDFNVIEISELFSILFRELQTIIDNNKDASSLIHGMIKIAKHRCADRVIVDQIISYVEFCPECSGDCGSIWFLAGDNGKALLRKIFLENGEVSALLKLVEQTALPLTRRECIDLGVHVHATKDEQKIATYLQFIRHHPDLSQFEKARFAQVCTLDRAMSSGA